MSKSFKEEFIEKHGTWPGYEGEFWDDAMENMMNIVAERMDCYEERIKELEQEKSTVVERGIIGHSKP